MSLIDEIESMYNQNYSDIVVKTLEDKFENELYEKKNFESAEQSRQMEESEIRKKISTLRSSLSKYKNIKNHKARAQNEIRHEKRRLIQLQIQELQGKLEDINMERG